MLMHFVRIQRLVDDGANMSARINAITKAYDSGVSNDAKRLAALLLFLNRGDAVGPDDVEVSKYDTCVFEHGQDEYLVLTDEEANQRWDDYLESYIDDCLEIPAHIVPYFDHEAWKRDARHDGRGHALSPYDGVEHSAQDYYVYRIN